MLLALWTWRTGEWANPAKTTYRPINEVIPLIDNRLREDDSLLLLLL